MIPNKSAVLHIKESLVCKLVGIDSFAQINIWFVKILGDFGRLKFSMLRIFGFDPNPRPHTINESEIIVHRYPQKGRSHHPPILLTEKILILGIMGILWIRGIDLHLEPNVPLVFVNRCHVI